MTLEPVMHDGTKIKANVGTDSFRREDRLKEHQRLAQEQVAAIGDPRQAAAVTPRVQAARQSARERQERPGRALIELEKIRQQPSSEIDPEEARASTKQYHSKSAHLLVKGIGITRLRSIGWMFADTELRATRGHLLESSRGARQSPKNQPIRLPHT